MSYMYWSMGTFHGNKQKFEDISELFLTLD